MTCEAVGAPCFAADAVMNEKQTGGIVFLLHGKELRIVCAPIGSLPIRFKETAFRHIGSRLGYQTAHLVHRPRVRACLLAPGAYVGFVAWHARNSRRPCACADCE